MNDIVDNFPNMKAIQDGKISVPARPVKVAHVFQKPPGVSSQVLNKDLLSVPEVIHEIEKHKWLESEKAGHDVGYEWASEDWLKRYAQEWRQSHR